MSGGIHGYIHRPSTVFYSPSIYYRDVYLIMSFCTFFQVHQWSHLHIIIHIGWIFILSLLLLGPQLSNLFYWHVSPNWNDNKDWIILSIELFLMLACSHRWLEDLNAILIWWKREIQLSLHPLNALQLGLSLMPLTIKCCRVTDELFTAEIECGMGRINKNKVRNQERAAAPWRVDSVFPL